MKTQYLVTFDCAADTRWHDCQQHINAALQDYLHAFGKVMTRGAIPCVTVEFLPSGPLPAGRRVEAPESVAAHQVNPGTGDGSPVLQAPTSARKDFFTEGAP